MAHKPEKDIRVAATSRIWVLATVMLAICIPIAAVTGDGVVLPIAVILGATVGTVAIWRSSNNQSKNSPLLTNSLQQLQQRVANLEIICSSQELDLHNNIKKLESKD